MRDRDGAFAARTSPAMLPSGLENRTGRHPKMRFLANQALRRSMLASASLYLAACATVSPDAPYSIEPLASGEAETLSDRWQLFEDTLEEKRQREFRRLYGDDEIIVTASRVTSPGSITNNQFEGVDEGDVVKRLGDHLIVLRRGRLFSFYLGSAPGQLRPLDYVDVESRHEGDDQEELDAWYDEILVHDETLILLGYSYEHQGSVIQRYRVRADGTFERLGEILLRSGDYFDTSNYATRIVGDRLVVYLPRPFLESSEGVDVHPIVNGTVGEPTTRFEETVYTPLQDSAAPLRHSILTCPLDQAQFTCSARSIVGPRARIFYISADAFYLWLNSADWAYNFLAMSSGEVRRLARRIDQDRWDDDIAIVYRVPLDGSSVEVVQTSGVPINQFSFDETPEALRVFVDDAHEESHGRNLYWLDIPKKTFSTALATLSPERRNLLNVFDEGYVGASRFIGPYLLYSEINFGGRGEVNTSRLWIKNLDQATVPIAIDFEPGILQRIEPLGRHAVVVVENEEGVRASTVRLGEYAQLAATLAFPRAAEADWRSHGFNYRWSDAEGGVFGFPVFQADQGEEPRNLDWYDTPVVMKFVGVRSDLGTFHSGQLVADEALLDVDDNCEVSCVDWYGDARPIFIDDRVFALIDYELIEAAGSPFTITEIDRVNALVLLRD